MTDETLSFFRDKPQALEFLTALLRIKDMVTADRLHLTREMIAYVESGDIAAGRALLQHARGRWEESARKRAESISPG